MSLFARTVTEAATATPKASSKPKDKAKGLIVDAIKQAVEGLAGNPIKSDATVFSTVHKAKGMEADNVFIMRPDLMPHPKATGEIAVQQEENIRYVAITRAKKNLRWVTPPPKVKNPWEDDSTGSWLHQVVEDKIPGGKGDKLKATDVDPMELAKGIEVEGEHTKNKAVATEIALDHLAENPRYYTKLKKIHKD